MFRFRTDSWEGLLIRRQNIITKKFMQLNIGQIINNINIIMRNLKFSIIISILTYLIAVIFIFAGLSKIVFINDFIKIIHQLEIFNYLSTNFLFILGLILSSIEIFAGIMLLTKSFKLIGAIFSSVLLSFFIFFISFMLITENNIKCGCFGPLSQNISPKLLTQDMILLIFALTIYIDYSKKNQNNNK